MTAVLADRAKRKAEFERRGASLTLTAYFVAASVDAIRAVPEANGRWNEDAILLNERIDIGVGTAIEGRGLIVPVIRDAGTLDLAGIAAALGELVLKAREDRLTAADLQGGTFTISNHGVSGSLLASPIVINQPQSAILGVGKLEKRAVVATVDGRDSVVIRPCCYVTLTIDHRVLDGHQANRFMETFVRRLEAWS
jgi:2-oxoglutarate dehydrogenase E2 component (dihydrolipoamide succinyltransferase)